jgi:hypothetical protein
MHVGRLWSAGRGDESNFNAGSDCPHHSVVIGVVLGRTASYAIDREASGISLVSPDGKGCSGKGLVELALRQAKVGRRRQVLVALRRAADAHAWTTMRCIAIARGFTRSSLAAHK